MTTRCASVVNSAKLNPLAPRRHRSGLLCTLIVSPPRAIHIQLSVERPASSATTTIRRRSVPPIYGRFPADSGIRSPAIAAWLCLHFGHFRLKAPRNLLTRLRINAIRCETEGANAPIYIHFLLSAGTDYCVFLLVIDKLRRFALN